MPDGPDISAPDAPDIPVQPVGPVDPTPDTTVVVVTASSPQIESGIAFFFPFNLPTIGVADDEECLASSDQRPVELGDRGEPPAADAPGAPIGGHQSGERRAPDVLARLAHGAGDGRETLADPSGIRSVYEPDSTREPNLSLDSREPGHRPDEDDILQH